MTEYTDAHLRAGLLPSDLPPRLDTDTHRGLPSDRRPSWRDRVLPSDMPDRPYLPSDVDPHGWLRGRR